MQAKHPYTANKMFLNPLPTKKRKKKEKKKRCCLQFLIQVGKLSQEGGGQVEVLGRWYLSVELSRNVGKNKP